MLRFRCPWPAGGSGAPSRGGTILINGHGNVRLLGFWIRSSPSQIITFLLTKSCLNSEAVSPRAKTPQPTLKTHYSYLSHTHFIIAINLTLHTRINTWLVNVFNSGVLHAYLLQTHKEGVNEWVSFWTVWFSPSGNLRAASGARVRTPTPCALRAPRKCSKGTSWKLWWTSGWKPLLRQYSVSLRQPSETMRRSFCGQNRRWTNNKAGWPRGKVS